MPCLATVVLPHAGLSVADLRSCGGRAIERAYGLLHTVTDSPRIFKFMHEGEIVRQGKRTGIVVFAAIGCLQ